MTPDHNEILARIRSLPGLVAVTYEAGPTGFGLARSLGGAAAVTAGAVARVEFGGAGERGDR